MAEHISSSEPKNPLKSEHLNPGINPIMACIGTQDQFTEFPGDEKEPLFYERPTFNPEGTRNVDYYENPEILTKRQFKNAGRYSYVISPIDSTDKFSKSFVDCTGLIVTGTDKETGENISFVSHEDPQFFLKETNNQSKFANDLRDRLKELKERSVIGTIDAVIVGGNYFKTDQRVNDPREYQIKYLESVKLLSQETQAILGFEPVVMTGPKTERGRDNIFYDTVHRRLYIIRPAVGDTTTQSFLQSDIKNQEKKW